MENLVDFITMTITNTRLVKKIAYSILLLFVIVPLVLPTVVEAAAGKVTQEELEKIINVPQPRIKIPGLNFSDKDTVIKTLKDETGPAGSGQYLSIPFLGEYLAALFRLAVVVASLLAVIFIIFAGFVWTTSGGSSTRIDSAKTMITRSITGLIIAVSSYVILFTINPELVQFRSLKILLIQGKDLGAEYEAASSAASSDLGSYPQAIPQLVDGKYNEGLKVPPASSCSSVCVKPGRCADQALRDMAYEAQLKTGYPAATMIAQYLVEGSTFGIKCGAGVFIPSESRDKKGIPSDVYAQSQAHIDEAACGTRPNCAPGFTWECVSESRISSKYKLDAPIASRDKNASGGFISCKKKDKPGEYYRLSGYACFSTPPKEGNKLAPLVNFYERNKCISKKRTEYGADPKAFAVAVQSCGYATAQNYAEGLINTMKKFCLIGEKDGGTTDTGDPEVKDGE